MHRYACHLSVMSYNIITSKWNCASPGLIEMHVNGLIWQQDVLRLKWVQSGGIWYCIAFIMDEYQLSTKMNMLLLSGSTGSMSVPQLEHSNTKGKVIGSYVWSALWLVRNCMHAASQKHETSKFKECML